MAILLLAFWLQEHFTPYDTQQLNYTEKLSILVAAVTIYSGLFFLTADISSAAKFLLLVGMCLVNFAFLGVWLKNVSQIVALKLIKSQPFAV